jgi:hypothetical protein
MKRQSTLLRKSVEARINRTQGPAIVMQIFRFFISCLIVVAVLSTTGCMGMAIRHFEKGTESSYSELKSSLAPVPAGSGRLFLYMVDGGPNPLLTTTGYMGFCTVDEDVYGVMGKTYWYIDLPTGNHRITANCSPGILGRVYYGKNVADFDLKEGEIKYCRIDRIGFLPNFAPVMVESPRAEQELMSLDFYKNFNKNKKARKD